jgi:hypothetical protein
VHYLKADRDEMTTKLAILESKFDRFSISPTGKGILPTPNHVMSTFRVNPLHENGTSSREGSDFIQREVKFQFLKSDCPGFAGENPI